MTEQSPRPDGHEHTPLYTSRRFGGRKGPAVFPIVGGLLVVLVLVGIGWWWTSSRAETPVQRAPEMSEAQRGATTPAAVDMGEMPSLDASDAFVRNIVSGISSRPQFATWLVNDDLARRFVLSVVQVAHGRSPVGQVEFMAPKDDFSARSAEGEQYMDPKSYHRYDLAAVTFASLDTEGTAQAFRNLHPLFEKAYRELGLKDHTFDETLAMAFHRLLSVQVPTGPVEVVPLGAGYGFADPKLEALSPAEKNLIRMGPQNAQRVQAKIRELADALELSVTTEPETPDASRSSV